MAPHFTRSSWAALAAAALLVLGGLLLAGYRLAQPDDSVPLALDDRSAPPGLPTGDGRAVVAIDGRDAMALLADAMALRASPPPGWRVGGTPHYQFRYHGGSYEGHIMLTRPSPPRLGGWFDLGLLLYAPLALFVFVRRPQLESSQALLLFAAALVAAGATRSITGGSGGLRTADLLAPGVFWPAYLLSGALAWLPLAHFMLVFPRPKLRYLRHRRLTLGLLYGLPPLALAGLAAWSLAIGQPLRLFPIASAGGGALLAAIAAGTLWSLAHSYRHTRDAADRAQLLWGGLGLALFSLWIVALLAGALLGWARVAPAGEWLWEVGILTVLAPPLGMALGILRSRLFDIDIVLSRALAYSALTLCLAAISGAIIGGIGLLAQGSGSLPLTLLALGAAGALALPLQQRIQRAVDRALYGDRDQPYAALERLGARLGGAIEPDAVLQTIVDSIADALRLPYVALTAGAGVPLVERRDARLPPGQPPCERFALAYRGQALGALLAAPRGGEQQLSPRDQRLLQQLAAQAGAAVYAAQLTGELRQSREQLVAAREEERRRLQRDIHDGLGPTLAGMTLKIDAARNLLAADPARADRQLAELRGQIQGAVEEIRRLVYALRPPALDQAGLAGAIEQLASASLPDIRVDLDLPERLPSLPAAAEVAAYRIIQESLANIARHSGARRCAVRLEYSGAVLQLEVRDDGRGLPPDIQPGIGIQSMRRRAEEIGGQLSVSPAHGGGTSIRATLPAAAPGHQAGHPAPDP